MSENLNLKKIRVLVLEDNPAEAEINIRELRRAGFDPEWLCVDTESDFLAALSPPPDLILSDYSMPQFDGMRAVALLRERKLDTPFILISGTMGEEVAVKSIKEGADDFLLKDRLARLGPAVVGALQNKRLRDERRQADEQTHRSAQQQIAILNALPAHIALLDPQGLIITVNDAWRRFASANVLLGTDFSVGQNYIEVCERAHGECSEEASDAAVGIRRVLNGELTDFALEYPCHSPAEQRWFRLMVTPLSENERMGAVVMHVNITERKLAEVRIHYLNRIYAVLSDINQNIVREKDPEKMLAEACRIAVDKGRFLMAWIGLQETGASTLRLAAHAGAAGDYLERLKSALATNIAMHLPTSEVLGSGRHVIVNDIAHDPRKILWRESALPLGFRASAAFPIKVDGLTVGTFNLYACEPGFFTEEELRLLDELAMDIGYALGVHQKAEALKQKENEYHDLVENLSVGVVVHAPDTSILHSNSVASKQLGLTAENMSGKTAADTVWQFLNEDGSKMPLVEYPVNRVLSSGEAIRSQNLGIRLPNVAEVTWVLCDAHPVRDARGALLQIVVTIADVTDHRKAEAEFLQAEKRYRRLFEAAKDGILILDAETGMIDDVNPFMIELLGFPKEQFLRKALWELGFFKNLVANHVKFEELQRNEYVRYENLPLETVDGRQIDVEFISNVYYVNSKKVMQCNIRDITERKRVEASHIRLATAVEQASEAIVITDVQGNIVYTNPAFEKITGYTRAEALGKNPRILKSGKHDIAFYRELWATLKRGEAWHGRMINKRKNGSQFEEDATISPVRDASGKVVNYVAVKRDVTREIQLEAQFRQSQKMEAFGLLAGGVAHDFNNLMGVVIGYSDIWLMKLPPDAPIRGPLTAIRTAGERAADLTKQLLAFSRQTILEPKILDLNTVVREMEKMLKRLIGEDIHFTSILNPAIPRIRIDPGQLGQVLMNLCVNARDAMPRGGSLTIETRTTDFDETYVNEHPGAKLGRQIVFSVSDTGTGMPPEIVARIFEPFFTTKEVGKGTGLGLAVVHGVVTQSGGIIQVDSKVGVGTTFTLYFPATLDEVQTKGGSGAIFEYGGIETILVVEDEESLCEIAAETLKSFGYTVLKAQSGPDALKLVSEQRGTIDLVLTDVVMPKMSGRELAESLKQKLPKLKIIFMSGYTDDSVVRHGVHHEKVPFLQKPFAPFDLLKKVREELDKR